MADRSISLLPRKEDIRNKNDATTLAVQFELNQIKQHFCDSLSDINKQICIADCLSNELKDEEAKDILRAQLMFLEGILDFYIHEISKYAFIRMFTGRWPKTRNYECFPIPMATVEKGLKQPESTS